MPRTPSAGSCPRPAPPSWSAGRRRPSGTPTAAPGPRRRRPRVRPGRQHQLRPDARQGDRLGRGPRGGAHARWSTPSTAPAILGLTTNTGFVRALAAGDEFRDATIDTAWLDHAEVPAPDAESRWWPRPGSTPCCTARASPRPRATRSPPTAGASPARRPPPWSRWRRRRAPRAARRRARPARRRRRRARAPARRPHGRAVPRRPPRDGVRQRPGAQGRGVEARPAVRPSSGPTRSATTVRRPATAPWSRRCPAPSSTSSSPSASRWPRVRRWGPWRR